MFERRFDTSDIQLRDVTYQMPPGFVPDITDIFKSTLRIR